MSALLEKFFNPKSVAVVGAARDPKKVGHSILKNLRDNGYKGRLYPVNPKAKSILGLKTYPSVSSIKEGVDLAVITVPRNFVIDVMKDCGKKGVAAAIVITAGFKENGQEGLILEQQLLEVAAGYGIRVLGPNCLGMINAHTGLNASFAPSMPHKGNIAFFSQSGALCTAILDWSLSRGIGFSKFVSLGNKSDISELDMMEYLSGDPATKVILGYIEGVSSGREFIKKAWATVHKTPLIITKAGGTQSGARAASSHTGSLAGSERAFEAVFKQTGILRADTIEELFSFALAFSRNPLPTGPNLAVITNAGGPGIIAADACERSQARMAELQAATITRLRKSLPPTAGFFNPIDVIGDARADRYAAALEAALEDPGVDGALVLLTPQATTEPEATAKAIIDIRGRTEKPVLVSYLGGDMIKKGADLLNKKQVAIYGYPEEGVKGFEALVRYNKSKMKAGPNIVQFKDVNTSKARAVIDKARSEGKKELGEKEAREIIAAYGFRVPKNVLAATSSEAVKAARGIGYPVVMKIASPHILHKTDVGGVKVGMKNDKEVESAFLEITSNAKRLMPNAMVWGCMVQEMVTGGREVILGMSHDPSFGPLLMFGMGGIYVEALKDVSFRVAPIGKEEAHEMIEEIKTYPILKGLRGEKSSDIDAIEDSLLRLSQLVTDLPEVLEMDINPLLVLQEGQGSVAIDARFTII
ncbi:MAG TPA: acetate--CoA ligase family protein [Nitrospirota bacterium]